MSLHTLAQHLQSAGRGDDKVLVHMTPREVGGLQSLAMAHGGSLTINPETGLPEAGFLSSILPIVAGLALGPAGAGITFGGLSSAASAGLLVGGASALASGSLQKGLMAGLGAYGGAGMGAGLMGAAPAAAGLGSAQTVAAQNAAAAAAAQNSQIGQSFANMGAAAPAATTLPVNPTMAAGAGSPFGMAAPSAGAIPPTAVTTTAPAAQQVATAATQQGIPSVLQQTGQNLQQAFGGLQELFKDPEKAKQYLGEQKYNLLGAALSASNMEQRKQQEEKRLKVPDYSYDMKYAPSPLPPGSTAERTFFAADGGMAVENMSRQNALMDNQKYPMAYQTTPTYALPSERPIAQNVLYPATDAGVTPYSGIATLAKGGPVVDKYGVERYKTGKSTSASKSAASPAVVTKSDIQAANLAGVYGPQPTASTGVTAGGTKNVASTTFTPVSSINLGKTTATSSPGVTTTGGTTAGAAAQTTPLPKGIASLANKLTDANTDIKGANRATLNTNFGTELTKQTKELTTFKNNGTVKQALAGKFGSDVKTQVEGIIAGQQADIDAVKTAQTKALDLFSSSTGRSSESISPRGTRVITPEGEKVMVFDPKTGKFTENGPEEKYNPYTSKDKITATSGWSKDKKYIEPEDVVRVFEEIVGRSPTEEEKTQFVGKNMSMLDLAKKANSVPDVKEKRSFTEDDIQEQAKYYWGREMTSGELSAFKNKNFTYFGSLRDALISNKAYLDNLNTLNQEFITKEKTPAPVAAAPLEVADAFERILGRRPNDTEFGKFATMPKADIEKALYGSNEYVRTKLLQTLNPEDYIYDLRPYTPMGTDTTVAGEGKDTVTAGTGKDTITTLPAGGGSGFVPGLQTSAVPTAEQIAAFKKRYEEYAPTLGNVSTISSAPLPVSAEGNLSAENIYQPIYKPVPEYNIKGAMAYRPVATELGLENLYKQLGQKMPDLKTGLSLTPSQGIVAPSAFGNVTPGLVTLQSAATPQPYVPPTPVIPGTTTQIPALTPQEQAILSAAATSSAAQGKPYAAGGYAGGGYNLGDYSDGGRLLKGPGDGVSDSIPASIGGGRPARLADGEFVIPARIVSELGNGSTDAGARQLYAMMDRIQRQRRKTVGKGRVAVDSKASKMLPV